MNKYPNDIIKNVYPMAKEFHELLMTKPRDHTQESIAADFQHPFCHWLHKQENYLNAEQRALEAKLTKSARVILSLEIACAFAVTNFCNQDNNFYSSAIVTPVEQQDAKKICKELLAILENGIYFKLASEQSLVRILLSKFLTNPPKRNIFCSGKNHHDQERELFSKKIMDAFFLFDLELNPTIIADITIDLGSIFFTQPMDRSDARKLATKIRETRKEENSFLQKTVAELLKTYSMKLQST